MNDIVLLHGMGGPNPLNYIEDELKKQYTVYKPVMPGFTSEDGSIRYSDKLYTDYVEQFRQEQGLDKIIVIGYSMGGRTAINYTVAYPENVKKLILIDSAGLAYIIPLLHFRFGRPFLMRILPYFLKYSWVQELLGKPDFVNTKSEEYELGKGWVSDMMKDPIVRRNFTEILTSIGSQIPNIEEKLSNINVPVQLLWADKDRTANISAAYKAIKHLNDYEFRVLHGYRHMAPMEKPTFYSEHIVEFIEKKL